MHSMSTNDVDRLSETIMAPRDVARVFCVTPKTISRWAAEDKLPSYRTLGGHRRFNAWMIVNALVDTGLSVDAAYCAVKHAIA
jgi:excisionase family DNA binding protein